MGMVAWNSLNRTDKQYSPTWANAKWDTASHEGKLSESRYTTLSTNSYLYQAILSYHHTWNIHDVDAMLGASLEKYTEDSSYDRVSGFPNDKSYVFDKNTPETVQNNQIDYDSNYLFVVMVLQSLARTTAGDGFLLWQVLGN